MLIRSTEFFNLFPPLRAVMSSSCLSSSQHLQHSHGTPDGSGPPGHHHSPDPAIFALATTLPMSCFPVDDVVHPRARYGLEVDHDHVHGHHCRQKHPRRGPRGRGSCVKRPNAAWHGTEGSPQRPAGRTYPHRGDVGAPGGMDWVSSGRALETEERPRWWLQRESPQRGLGNQSIASLNVENYAVPETASALSSEWIFTSPAPEAATGGAFDASAGSCLSGTSNTVVFMPSGCDDEHFAPFQDFLDNANPPYGGFSAGEFETAADRFLEFGWEDLRNAEWNSNPELQDHPLRLPPTDLATTPSPALPAFHLSWGHGDLMVGTDEPASSSSSTWQPMTPTPADLLPNTIDLLVPNNEQLLFHSIQTRTSTQLDSLLHDFSHFIREFQGSQSPYPSPVF